MQKSGPRYSFMVILRSKAGWDFLIAEQLAEHWNVAWCIVLGNFQNFIKDVMTQAY